jgi:hypothetical protein
MGRIQRTLPTHCHISGHKDGHQSAAQVLIRNFNHGTQRAWLESAFCPVPDIIAPPNFYMLDGLNLTEGRTEMQQGPAERVLVFGN